MKPKLSVSQPSVLDYSSYREFLRDYARFAKFRNRAWSYGVWARKLGLSSKSSLTMILNGQRHPGKSLIERLAVALEMTSEERECFLRLVDSEKRTADPIARLVFKRGSAEKRKQQRRKWLEVALKDLCRLPDFVDDPSWIREQLHLPVEESEILTCLETLKQIPAGGPQETSVSLTQDEILRFHEDGSQASAEALIHAPVEQRVFLTSILRISRKQISEAAEILSRTQRELGALLEVSEGESIYELHLHFFPLTKK